MSGQGMIVSAAFFVCGTPRNKEGFQYSGLGPVELPGDPTGYLDRPPSSDKGLSLDVDRLAIAGSEHVRYRVSRHIIPMDADASRGNYLGVGFLTSSNSGLDVLSSCIQRTREIMFRLEAYLTPAGKVVDGFDFSGLGLRVGEGIASPTHSPMLEADRVLQAINSTGIFSAGQISDSAVFEDKAIYNVEHASYQYSRGEVLDSLAIIESDRRRVEELAQVTVASAERVGELAVLATDLNQVISEGLNQMQSATLPLGELKGRIEASLEKARELRGEAGKPLRTSGGVKQNMERGRDFDSGRVSASLRESISSPARRSVQPRLSNPHSQRKLRYEHRSFRWPGAAGARGDIRWQVVVACTGVAILLVGAIAFYLLIR